MYNNDEIDNIIFKYFENKKNDEEIPELITNVISNFKYKKVKKNKLNIVVKKIAIIITSIVLTTSGIVFAKEIKDFVNSLFINSTESINVAIENDYAQNIDMEYAYDNNIGIKVTDVLIDDFNLNISFSYELEGKKEIDKIRLYEYEITGDENTFLYELDYNKTINDKIPIINSVSELNDGIKVNDNHFVETILYHSDKFPIIKTLYVNIKSLKLNNDEIINGNWALKIDLDDKFYSRENIIYKPSYNEHLLNSEIILSETTLKVHIELDEKYNFETKDVLEINPRIEDENGNIYLWSNYESQNMENSSKYNIEFNISKYYENINTLYLRLNIDKDKEILIQFNKN